MNKVVYKLPLPEPGKSHTYELRVGVAFLHVGVQNGKACLWFEIDPEVKDNLEYVFTCIGTGWAFEYENQFHLGTVITDSGFVWHYYARFIND